MSERVIPRWAHPLLVCAAAFVALLVPLHEVDLAQHLATGEWIARHHAVPFVEPFAWTRAGQPYFAYSWLAQLLFFLLLDTLGPLGLHLLEALIVGGATAAALWAGKQFRWHDDARLAFAVLHVALMWGVASTLRPQQILFVAVPLAWGVCARIHERGINARRLIALMGVAALAANTHIFFPMTAIPVAYFLCSDVRWRMWLACAAALLIGWLLTPYAFVWPQVFALNFGHNVLLGRPPSILEFLPGLEYAANRPGVKIAAATMLVAVWVGIARSSDYVVIPSRERTAQACFWAAGLILFAYAGRLILGWWALSLPIVGYSLNRAAEQPHRYRASRMGKWVFAAVLVIIFTDAAPPVSPVFWYFEGGTKYRMLPRAGEDPALWLPGWLQCNTKQGAAGRIYTEFNYGSELTWRMPGYSPSIDGRTIFPDSIAVDFSFQSYGRLQRHATAWTGADLALLDRSFWLAPVLDQDTAWILLAQGRRTSRGAQGALWAKREWWRTWGNPNAAIPVDAIYPGDPRGVCDKTGDFPSLHWPKREAMRSANS